LVATYRSLARRRKAEFSAAQNVFFLLSIFNQSIDIDEENEGQKENKEKE
jgi:hypothetical protein